MTPLQNMWFAFFGIFLMFASAMLSLLSHKLSGFWRFLVLSVSFIFLVTAGLIVLIIVIRGPLAD
ncbi:DUF2768 family protein [Salibacterium halotolerans]|uniref:DUF2768 domain-containing protein n=1 Tax=Salibacterium halotolerans TaxID=1884432 RepID=A0A1I5Q4M3_9BACI|nr:DUF2768 family protein [Salibacterium halotolerans]SFP41233.1 Protein of unknown function [Salibacterium halotolerans]